MTALRLAGLLGMGLALSWGNPGQLMAEPLPPGCQADLIASASGLPNGYSVRPGSYCDGSLPYLNRGELQVVSFTLGQVIFSPTQNELLLTRADGGAEQLHITGLDKRAGASYRLDGVVPNSGLHVDLNAAIRPKGIQSADLGFLAWTGSDADRVLTPIEAGAPQNPTIPAILVLRTPNPVIQATMQTCEVGGACDASKPIGDNLPEGSLIEVTLPRAGAVQDLEVKVTALGPGRSISGQVVKIRIPPG